MGDPVHDIIMNTSVVVLSRTIVHPHSGCSTSAADSALLALGIPPHSKREVVGTTFDSIFRAFEKCGESISRGISKSET